MLIMNFLSTLSNVWPVYCYVLGLPEETGLAFKSGSSQSFFLMSSHGGFFPCCCHLRLPL